VNVADRTAMRFRRARGHGFGARLSALQPGWGAYLLSTALG
jgi:hypothetical protein